MWKADLTDYFFERMLREPLCTVEEIYPSLQMQTATPMLTIFFSYLEEFDQSEPFYTK